MLRRLLGCVLFLAVVLSAKAQDLTYVKRITDTLTSEQFHGRGYVNDGGLKAAKFIRKEFEKAGLQKVHFQEFEHSINTFPNKVNLSFDGAALTPAVDFLVNATSKGCSKTTLKVKCLKVANVESLKQYKKWKKKTDWAHTALVIEREVHTRLADKSIGEDIASNAFGAHTIINLTDQKLTWTVRDRHSDWVAIEMLASSFPKNAKHLEIEIDQRFVPDFQNRNVIGSIRGTKEPDSFIVFSAHYDHLGRMGKDACFYGANDNAGGAAMLCDLARHYGKPENAPAYSILFIAFAGEEAGLLGSKHYVDHPEVPLSQISYLVNLDLVTNGQDGFTVVNGSVFKQLFKHLKRINAEKEYVKAIKVRGKAANSDHYWFSENGVKAIFIYLLGEYPHYHDINDTADKPSWAAYKPFFKLLTDLTAERTN